MKGRRSKGIGNSPFHDSAIFALRIGAKSGNPWSRVQKDHPVKELLNSLWLSWEVWGVARRLQWLQSSLKTQPLAGFFYNITWVQAGSDNPDSALSGGGTQNTRTFFPCCHALPWIPRFSPRKFHDLFTPCLSQTATPTSKIWDISHKPPNPELNRK